MTEKIKMDLFVRLMRSPSHRRTDVLEFMGSTAVAINALFDEGETAGLVGAAGNDALTVAEPTAQRT